MLASPKKAGVTLIELLIVIVVLAVIASIAIPAIGTMVERTRLEADKASVTRLNASTRLYRLNRHGNDPFEDEQSTSEMLIQRLVTEGYLSAHSRPQSQDAEFVWSHEHSHWFLSIDNTIVVIPTDEAFFTVHGTNNNLIVDYDVSGGSYVVIPTQINNITITEISGQGGQGAFQNKQIETVILPSGLIAIGNFAFRNNLLTSITFPQGLARIGISAFADNQITEVILPNSITSVAASAFHSNPITRITIGDDVTIGDTYSFGIHRPGGDRNFNKVYELGGAGTYNWNGTDWIKE